MNVTKKGKKKLQRYINDVAQQVNDDRNVINEILRTGRPDGDSTQALRRRAEEIYY